MEAILRASGDVELLSDMPTEDDQNLQPLADLAIPVSQAGKVSLWCYLAPLGLPQDIRLKRLSPVKVDVDLDRSNLIDFWRPFYNGQVVGRGRLWYENRFLDGCAFAEKSPEFCRWADRVYSRVKRTLRFDKERGAYLGADAADRISRGTLTTHQRAST